MALRFFSRGQSFWGQNNSWRTVAMSNLFPMHCACKREMENVWKRKIIPIITHPRWISPFVELFSFAYECMKLMYLVHTDFLTMLKISSQNCNMRFKPKRKRHLCFRIDFGIQGNTLQVIIHRKSFFKKSKVKYYLYEILRLSLSVTCNGKAINEIHAPKKYSSHLKCWSVVPKPPHTMLRHQIWTSGPGNMTFFIKGFLAKLCTRYPMEFILSTISVLNFIISLNPLPQINFLQFSTFPKNVGSSFNYSNYR
jgi:hypothetical protein